MCRLLQTFLALSVFLLSAGCDANGREQALRQKDSALNRREAELVNRERIVEAAEAKLRAAKGTREGNSRPDSSLYYQPSLTGEWQVKMTCTESNCAGFAVGDSRTEQWSISYIGYTLFVKATSKNTYIRSYNGYVFENYIELRERKDSTRSTADVRMKVRLQVSDSTTLSGDREIVQENNCKVLYALQLKKIQ